jgi:2-(1,2-epoxy-1,2-dihydrophenyl)acetyl-CoA isomerase
MTKLDPSEDHDRPTASLSVHAATDSGVLRILLDRTDAFNALDLTAARQLLQCCELAASAAIGSVLIEASGRNFCAGGDVRYFAQPDRPHTDGLGELVHTLHAAIRTLNALDVPVLSAVQGWCVGAGLGLALVADVVIAAESARFRSAYTAIGFTPDLGASWHLPRLVVRVRAGTFIFGNRPIDAATALAWGMVGEVVPDTELSSTAGETAARLAAGPRGAHRRVRRLLGRDRELFEQQLALEAVAVTQAADSAEGREGVAAFLAGRPPVFTGLDDQTT